MHSCVTGVRSKSSAVLFLLFTRFLLTTWMVTGDHVSSKELGRRLVTLINRLMAGLACLCILAGAVVGDKTPIRKMPQALLVANRGAAASSVLVRGDGLCSLRCEMIQFFTDLRKFARWVARHATQPQCHELRALDRSHRGSVNEVIHQGPPRLPQGHERDRARHWSQQRCG